MFILHLVSVTRQAPHQAGEASVRQVGGESFELQRIEGLFVLVLSCCILLKLSSMQKQNQLTIAAILEKPVDEYALSS